MSQTNYGTLLKKASTSIGSLVSIDPPEYSNPAVESTNHSSAGVRTFVSGGLREMAEFKCTINYELRTLQPSSLTWQQAQRRLTRSFILT